MSPDELLVIYDDFSLDQGTLRLRPSGRSGGHRGLQSIIDALETREIPRLRIGIGPLPSGIDPTEFLLSRITNQDWSQLEVVLKAVPDVMVSIDQKGFDAAMSEWNPAEFHGQT